MQYRGALVVSPISTPGQQVVGTINVDSLHCYGDESAIDYCFNTHEINFYQVAMVMSVGITCTDIS